MITSFIESLESRQFLSAASVADVEAPDSSPAITLSRETRAAPRVTGKYSGKVSFGFSPSMTTRNFKTTVWIKSVSPSGKVKGTLQVPGLGITNFSIQGSINQDGLFSAYYNKNGISGSLTATVENNRLQGSIYGYALGQIAAGQFDLKKV